MANTVDLKSTDRKDLAGSSPALPTNLICELCKKRYHADCNGVNCDCICNKGKTV